MKKAILKKIVIPTGQSVFWTNERHSKLQTTCYQEDEFYGFIQKMKENWAEGETNSEP